MAVKAAVEFELIDKKIGSEDVAGLVSLQFDPAMMGEKVIQMIESVASPKVVVGFSDPDDISFFIDCNWVNGGVYDGKVLVASELIDEDKFDGNIW